MQVSACTDDSKKMKRKPLKKKCMTTLDRVQQILSFIPKDSKDNIHLRKKLEELEQKIINKIEVNL